MTQKHKMTQQQSRSTGKWRKKSLVLFALFGVITSFSLFWRMKKEIMLRRKDTLASMCDERARMLQDQFNVSMNHVHSLAILVSVFHHGRQSSAIDQKTFEDYTERTSFERALTSGVFYAMRVRRTEREHVERQYGWTIKKMDAEDQTLANTENFSTSPVRDEYAPVIFSLKTVPHIVSVDMMSGKEDRENILRARASGKGALTSPFKLLKSNHLGFVLIFAVYNIYLPPDATPAERINATVGYLGASYDVHSLVEKLPHQLASKHTINVNVYDTTSPDAPITMYGADVADNELLHISHLDFGDPARKHEMHCRFKHEPPPPWQAISSAASVLVITLLVCQMFCATTKRIAKVEHDYWEMMELKHLAEAADMAKSQFLATVLHDIRTPVNGVLGVLEMLKDTNSDVWQLDYLQTAYDSGKALISSINKVLDQAKIESGRLELEAQALPFDPRAVHDKARSIFSGKPHDRRIEVEVESDPAEVKQEGETEVLFLVDPIDEVAIQNLKAYKEKNFVDISKEDLDLCDKNEEKEKEVKQEFGQTCDWIKKRLGDKVASVQVSNRLSTSPCVLASGKFRWSADMERLMKAQTVGDPSSLEFMKRRRVFEINPDHPIIRTLNAVSKNSPNDEEALRAVDLLYDTALISSGFTPESPAQLGGKIYEMMNMALLGKWGGAASTDDVFQQQQVHVPETIEAEVVEPPTQ